MIPAQCSSFRGHLLAGCALLGAVLLPGQSVAPTAADEPVLELSPFVVDATQDTGYLAGNTLSGTRLRTDIKDIGGSISVYNQEFLKNIGARDMQDALRYEVNSENENEVVYNDTEGTLSADATTTRVRGMTGGQLTRGFFNTQMVIDAYNIDRLTVSRGPNSILFGIGSPSGSFDATLKQASSARRFGSVSLTFDENHTRRYELDFNLPLTKQLALRLDLLDQDKRTFMDPEFDQGSRQYVTATYRPFQKTSLTASYEKVENDRVRGRRHTLLDAVSGWRAAGKPIYDHFAGQWLDSAGNPVSYPLGQIAARGVTRAYIFGNNREVPASAWAGITLKPEDQAAVTQGNQALYLGGSGATTQFINEFGMGILGFNNGDLYPDDLNITGLANRAWIDGNITTVDFQQELLPRLNLDLAYNREYYENISHEPLRGNFAVLQADVNKYLVLHDSAGDLLTDVDGNPVRILNPNAGRYFVAGEEIGFQRFNTTDSYRGTLSYDLDLKQHRTWLGTHTFAAMYQMDDTDGVILKERTKNLGSLVQGGGIRQGDNNIQNRFYVDLPGDSDGSGQTTAGNWVSPAENGLPWWQTSTGPLQEDAIHNRIKNEAILGVVSSRFEMLSGPDELVTTIGFRRDRQRVYDAPISSLPADPITGLRDWPRAALPSTPTIDESGNTSTLGFVYHTPLKGFDLSYARSDNFTPQAKYRDFEGRPQTAKKGKSDEYGVAYTTPDNKFRAKLVYFKATALNEKEEDWFYWEPAWTALWEMEYHIQQYVEVIYPLQGAPDHSADLVTRGAYDPDLQSDREVPFRDRASRGWELELIAQPWKNLNLRFTAAKTEAVDSHIGLDMIAFIQRRLPVWEKYADLTASWMGQDLSDPAMNDPVAIGYGDDNPGRRNQFSAGYGAYNAPGGLARIEDLAALEGAKSLRARDWTANLTANYTIHEGRWAGFSFGGGARYRAKNALGYLGKASASGLLPAGTMVSDLSQPVYGDDYLNLDVWVGYNRDFTVAGHTINWAIDLYAWNVNSSGGLKPGSVNFAGQIDRWIIAEPRVVSITNTISF